MNTKLQKIYKENAAMNQDSWIKKKTKSPIKQKERSRPREAFIDLANEASPRFKEPSRADRDVESLSDRLRTERQKALKTLERASILEHTPFSSNERHSLAVSPTKSLKSCKSLGLNKTDYVPYGKKSDFNISDLVADHTIDIKSMSSSGAVSKISFEPSEITGRSTMCIPSKNPATRVHAKSVKEILAQSLVEDIRNLSETLPSYDDNVSLTRTVDNIPDSDSSYRGSFANYVREHDSELMGESFKPAELMSSKLNADERAWEEQYADIPRMAEKPTDDFQRRLTDTAQKDQNFSIGSYFNKHSESLRNIVPNTISPEKRPPVALHETSSESSRHYSSSFSFSNYNQDMQTPQPDGKKYSLYSTKSNEIPTRDKSSDDQEISDRSQLLSMSAIEKALHEINSEDSVQDIRNRFYQARKVETQKNTNKNIPANSHVRKQNMTEKENHIPEITRAPQHNSMEDTLAVTLTEISSHNNMDRTPPQSKLDDNAKSMKYTRTLTKNRKRSHSSTRLGTEVPSDSEIPIRRSRSPSTQLELAAASGSRGKPSTPVGLKTRPQPNGHLITDSDRQFLLDSKSPDCGKYSLPNFGLLTQSSSTIAAVPLKSRSNSQCSTSSEFSHRDGKWPLKASVLELVWGSVRLRKSVQKSFQIKNTSHKRLIIKAEVSGPGFQLISSCEETSNLMRLQGQECRTLYVNFCPTVIGDAAGQLIFSSPYATSNSEGGQIINLYGHGGHASIITQGLYKGPIGSDYLPLGELKQLSTDISKSFTVYNKGSLPAFIITQVNSTGLDLPRLRECIEVSPANLLLNPESSVNITITFRPRRDDIKKIFRKLVDKNREVITLVNLLLIYGENATRRRIKSLIQQMNSKEKSQFEGTCLSNLWNAFPEDQEYRSDMFKQKTDSANELLGSLSNKEIAITLNHSMHENTIQDTMFFSDNETIMFRTIISDASFCSNATDFASNNTDNDALEMRRNSVESWSIRPCKLEIDPMDRAHVKAVFTIESHFFIRQQFKVDSNIRHILQFSPTEGVIMAGEAVEVRVQMRFGFLPSEPIEIWVYLGDAKITLPVLIRKDNFPEHLK